MPSPAVKRKTLEFGAAFVLLAAAVGSLSLYLYFDGVNNRLRAALQFPDDRGSIVRYVSMGASPRVRDQAGVTPLIVAAHQGDAKLMQLLLDRGADVNLPTHSGITPLMSGVSGRKPETAVGFLLNHGADVKASDPRGVTALMTACENGETECVRLLLRAGAPINAHDAAGHTALTCAKRAGRQPAVRILKAAGAVP